MSLTQAILRWTTSAAATSEEALLAAARRGERDALAALYRRHSAAAFTLALRLTGDRDRANDVVQDAFLRAFDRLASYRSDAPFAAWLRRIVANVVIDAARRDARWSTEEPDLDSYASPERDLGARHDALGLLARLSPVARTVLVLYEYEGSSHREIAALLGRTEVWSKTVLSRSRARLAQWLAEEAG
jgi:RNA polymerase sigma factor (sigma-70 family)